jgi:hypothetical protein
MQHRETNRSMKRQPGAPPGAGECEIGQKENKVFVKWCGRACGQVYHRSIRWRKHPRKTGLARVERGRLSWHGQARVAAAGMLPVFY